MNYTFYFGSTYGSGPYDSSTYNGAASVSPTPTPTATPTAGTSTAGSTGSSSSNVLTNTGFDIAAGVTLASVIIFSSLVIRFWRRGKPSPTNLTR